MEYTFSLENGTMSCYENGNRADLVIRVRNEGRGLLKAWIRGENGKIELGTLMPEQNELRLRRSIPIEKLKQAGCWPIQDGGVNLIHAFSRGGLPQGWREEEKPERLFSHDPILREAARKLKGCLYYVGQEGFHLAVPYGNRRPFGLIPIFCFAQIRTLAGKQYAVFSFNQEGAPRRQEK
jgi:hypothetical protein